MTIYAKTRASISARLKASVHAHLSLGVVCWLCQASRSPRFLKCSPVLSSPPRLWRWTGPAISSERSSPISSAGSFGCCPTRRPTRCSAFSTGTCTSYFLVTGVSGEPCWMYIYRWHWRLVLCRRSVRTRRRCKSCYSASRCFFSQAASFAVNTRRRIAGARMPLISTSNPPPPPPDFRSSPDFFRWNSSQTP